MNDALLTAIQYVNVALFGGLAVAAYRLHRRLDSERSRWLFATFTTISLVTIAGLLLPPAEEQTSAFDHFLTDVLITILLLFPYCLYRFASGFGPPARWVEVAFHAATATIVIVTFIVPPLAPAGEPLSGTGQLYLVLFMLHWTVLSLWVVARLWRGGRGQPSVARRRMRLLAWGTLLLNIALLLAGTRNEPGSALNLITTVITWGSASLFYFGFSPPSGLRHAWRQEDERQLREAEATLMSATTPIEVAETIVPRVAELLGGHGAALLNRRGVTLAATGFSPEQLALLGGAEEETIERDRLILPLRSGTLVVEASIYAPFFGDEELALLRSLGTFVDLALSRIELSELERRTAKDLERTNEELVALVYGISHDLRSPIVTVIGYLELLHTDAGHLLNEEARHYLERISVSARYMDSLIRDLLELSRIGRTQTEVVPVDLGAIIEDIAAELRRAYPAVTIVVQDLPTVGMNPVRTRQLFTNLMENAVRHGGREDITVTVSAQAASDDQVAVCVGDDGIGIPAQYRERVFGIFERLDQDNDAGSVGTGIGLSMCRKIVEQVDGTIWIEDTDVGTMFVVSLPTAVQTQSLSDVEVQRQ